MAGISERQGTADRFGKAKTQKRSVSVSLFFLSPGAEAVKMCCAADCTSDFYIGQDFDLDLVRKILRNKFSAFEKSFYFT